MKYNRTYLFITIASVALGIVLVIQVAWIVETAKVKEQLFNEKAILVLSRTAEALATDTATRQKIEACVGRNETRKIDSIFNHYMDYYNIRIGYYFEVKPGTSKLASISGLYNNQVELGAYRACLGETPSYAGLELKLVFPDKEEFIMEEMGALFITSIVLILVVVILSWRTVLSLLKEKKISEHTTEFLNNMTHEFKTPLTNIALAGKMMVKEANIKQEDKIKHYSGIILSENEKLRLQVEQVLSMTALERGAIPLQKTLLDFHQLIKGALKNISVQVESRQGRLGLGLEAGRYSVMGDAAHLTNALCNLIDNAIKYSIGTPQMSIRTSNEDENLVVMIRDNGIGIENEYHKSVFEPFFRVPTGNVHDVKGFGLGLAYTRRIIELHGGTIALESENGNGSLFTITIPYV